MFIELSEFLRCPESHEDTFCVVAPEEMAGRMIVRGLVGCPICHNEYPIERGVVRFGVGPDPAGRSDPPEADRVWSLLGLASPGGFVVLAGSAARLAEPLANRMDGVYFVAINPSPEARLPSPVSALVHPRRIPLRHAMARGVVLGAESAVEPWISEGVRVLLPGLRLVAAGEALTAPGLVQLAAGNGLWVGQKST